MYLIVLLGPSSIGKTKISIELAKEINAEIINADSRKVYKYLNIGTAKNKEALKLIPHHLIDFIDPKENFNLALFQNLAFKRIKEIFNRQKNALMVGGTGLYIDAVCEAYDLPPVSTDSNFREYLKKQS
ncbi:MAG: tRNA (adenosine(37)-N6)-dimethylallyltransferase MiaA, partial [Armatimonadetes bacterium]|nr:tRNA (adenosine(37)-N6)-dimethylallyltransferase MiaA [Armatimonadota bacterium]